jgi:DNA adenine methylase
VVKEKLKKLISASETSSSIRLQSNPSRHFPIHPFLRWAGGKRWFINKHSEFLPDKIRGRYIEPFLGSGSLFFHLRPKKAILSDINTDLIDTYKGVRSKHIKIYNWLKEHDENHSSDYFYKIRASAPSELAERAARFIYLNRTCFNGIYRVNGHGQFNVPIGTNTNVLFPTDIFSIWAKVLKGMNLLTADFEKVIDQAENGDFLFIDPPYTVSHNLNGFIHYNEVLFSWEDQVRLSHALQRARRRKAKILMTNANHDSIKSLYSRGFEQKVVSRYSTISASNEGRNFYEELIIRA